ncbi:MAG: hypothetical protein PVS2B2_08460 [Candidatus Acidiferrum sp.]
MAEILLVEDNLKLRQLLKGLIEAHTGWHVCGDTGDGLEAVAKAIELKPDVAVLDFALARLNGLQVAEKLLSACPTLAVILHTVHVFPAMIAEAKKVGIRDVVSKTETAGKLLDSIERLLKENPSASASVLNTLLAPELADNVISEEEQKPPEPN